MRDSTYALSSIPEVEEPPAKIARYKRLIVQGIKSLANIEELLLHRTWYLAVYYDFMDVLLKELFHRLTGGLLELKEIGQLEYRMSSLDHSGGHCALFSSLTYALEFQKKHQIQKIKSRQLGFLVDQL